ncbi:hypothetical protein CPB84DRAFT_1769434 [Gymnopilus junonius]|uniref:Uncharacterized protein n=1 Tax=Gymnopilus junonius TaxID=109634 RepID=A0A9P5NVZ8_GYMJU|nr:hypothetical protein CPB84DRAFT_1769434 [Gymnopilus junonius]
MSYIWSDLRDNHLKRLIDNLVQANPSVPITLSVLESYPSQSLGPNSSIPRQYSGYYDSLHDLTFNPNPANKITAGRVDNCIEILDSMKAQTQLAALHLIIVAATTPSDDNSLAFSGTGYSPWISLAQKMSEKKIHCHIVVSSQKTAIPFGGCLARHNHAN